MKITSVDHDIIVNNVGWASITRRNMELLQINYGDMFLWGVDMDEGDVFRSLYFIKADASSRDHGSAIKLEARKTCAGLQLGPILRLLAISPPFMCRILQSPDIDFGLRLPDYKEFSLGSRVYDNMKPHNIRIDMSPLFN